MKSTSAGRLVLRGRLAGRDIRQGLELLPQRGELPKDGRAERGCERRGGRRGDGDGGGKSDF